MLQSRVLCITHGWKKTHCIFLLASGRLKIPEPTQGGLRSQIKQAAQINPIPFKTWAAALPLKGFTPETHKLNLPTPALLVGKVNTDFAINQVHPFSFFPPPAMSIGINYCSLDIYVLQPLQLAPDDEEQWILLDTGWVTVSQMSSLMHCALFVGLSEDDPKLTDQFPGSMLCIVYLLTF